MKTNKCILLGYGNVQKGYRVFNRVTQKVVYSRNMKFDEQEMGRPPIEEESAQHPLVLEPIEASSSDSEGDKDASDDMPVVIETLPRRSTRERGAVNYYGFTPAHLVTYIL